MEQSTIEIGIIQVLLRRLETQRLPRARYLERKVASGAALNEFDLAFLEAALGDACELIHLLGHHPEYRHLVHQLLDLYHNIVARAEANDATPSGPPSGP